MNSQLSDEDMRVYQLAQQQRLDPVRAVLDNRKVAAISDSEQRMRVRRHLTGVTLPLDPDDEDMANFVATSQALADRFEAAQCRGESAVAAVNDDDKMKRFRVFNFLYGADDTIRNVVKKIVDSLPKIQIDPGDVVAVSTTSAQDALFWHVSDAATLRAAIDKTTYEVMCDFRLLDPDDTVFGPCMTHHKNRLERLKKLDRPNCVGRDGLPEPHKRDYLKEHFFTIPFAVGNIVILARICDLCLGAFLYVNRIDTNKIGEIEPICDGFGSVGGGPITASESSWDDDTVKGVAADWEARNGRSPSLIELQKALNGVAFVGAGSEQTKTIADKGSSHNES